tara:strand:+ start:2001 stop:2597 length:597 start_codon:yes stop_codon:yes gene_type:complete
MTSIVSRSLLSHPECKVLKRWWNMKATNNQTKIKDRKNGRIAVIQGSALGDAYGLELQDKVGSYLDRDITLTTSQFRFVTEGSYMPWHRNAPQYMYTCLIQLCTNKWQIGFREETPILGGASDEADKVVTLNMGDGVIYTGGKTYHGRLRLKGDYMALVLHYCDTHDRRHNQKDGRIHYGEQYRTREKIPSHGELQIA